MNVAVILNTASHVEVAVSVYLSLARIPGMKPTLFPMMGNLWRLRDLLDHLGIRYIMEPSSAEESRGFEKAVVITAYPVGAEYPPIPCGKHPFLASFKGRRVLITHRTDRFWFDYRGEKVISLSPTSVRFNIPYIHMCENPILDSHDPTEDSPTFLIQGRFEFSHRNLALIETLLSKADDTYKIMLLGTKVGDRFSGDSRVVIRQNLPELEFYRAASTCSFVIPLIDNDIRGGTYARSRFSSSFLFAFAGLKPVLLHGSVAPYYPYAVGAGYNNETEFVERFFDLQRSDETRLRLMRENARINRDHMRVHNTKVFKNILVR